MSLTPQDRVRRRNARRVNEGFKLLANFLNASAVAVLATAVIVPTITGSTSVGGRSQSTWILIAVGIHLIAQAVIRLMRSED